LRDLRQKLKACDALVETLETQSIGWVIFLVD
jgi:hypothetical protein